jgi:hypothetical protein
MVPEAASALIGQTDLYAALRATGAGLPPDAMTLAALLTALNRLGDEGRDTETRLRSVDQGLLVAVMRKGAGLTATHAGAAVSGFLAGADVAPLFRPEIAAGPSIALLTGGQIPDMPAFSDHAFDDWFSATRMPYGLGLYGENRTVYRTPQFADAASPEWRTVHLGIDVFAPAGTEVFSPLPGRVLHVTYNADPLDYGNTLILEHRAGEARFFTLYGHLGGSLPRLLQPGDSVAAGQLIAHLGDWHENGGWAPHLHFQIMTDMLGQTGGNFFGVGHASLWDVWRDICPDPNLILRLPPDRFSARG